jgi:hypothetical protein
MEQKSSIFKGKTRNFETKACTYNKVQNPPFRPMNTAVTRAFCKQLKKLRRANKTKSIAQVLNHNLTFSVNSCSRLHITNGDGGGRFARRVRTHTVPGQRQSTQNDIRMDILEQW